MIIIPWKIFSNFESEVTLDGTPYIIIRRWNSRGKFWTITFLDRNRNVIINNLKIVINYELIAWYPDRGLPPGQLYALDEKGDNRRLEQDDFINGDRYLIYITESEIAEL